MAYDILKANEQLHLLNDYDALNENEKEILLQEISNIDFDFVNVKHKQTVNNKGKLEPLEALKINEIQKRKDEFTKLGIEQIQKGKVGAVLLAGGQGSRLGSNKPKGMLNVGLTKTLYLFEILINNMLETVKQADAWIPLYIMTSVGNREDTVAFFEANKYFGYKKEYVLFFVQDMVACMDFDGKMLMENRHKLVLSPNGNGGWFSSMANAGLLTDIHSRNIEWLNVFSVDNVLQKIADPCFIGATIAADCVSGAKVVSKASPNEKVGVLCLEDGKPSIVEYYEMTDEMRYLKDKNGELAYNYGVILNYLLRTDELEQVMNNKLPVHVVEKKIPHMEQGQYIKPEQPNGYKFETLILDMIHMLDNCLAYEVDRKKEFAPIKNETGVDSLESARKLMQDNGICL